MKENLKENHRDSFSSVGIFLALAGSAVGLGNIWRFPYMMGENGGAAFIIVYMLMAVFLAMPIMISEFVIGRRSQVNAVSSFKKLAPGGKWYFTGILGVLTAFVIISFYNVVGGMSIDFLMRSFTMDFVKENSLRSSLTFSFCFYLLTSLIVSFGIKKGVEKCSKVMMPLLFILMLVIAVRSMLLPGAAEGLRYIFVPDFSAINGKVLIAALGQAFFSLSVGVGTVITYASYVSKRENILGCSTKTVFADTIFALVAGCAIMPAVFAFGLSPQEGPDLVFKTLPTLFEGMPMGHGVAILFFFALLLAALSSAISMMEEMVAFTLEQFHLTRIKALLIVSCLLMISTFLCTVSDKVFNCFDYISANFMMTIGALLIVLFVGWKMGKKTFLEEITNNGELKLSPFVISATFFLIKYVAPLAIIAIMVASLV